LEKKKTPFRVGDKLIGPGKKTKHNEKRKMKTDKFMVVRCSM